MGQAGLGQAASWVFMGRIAGWLLVLKTSIPHEHLFCKYHGLMQSYRQLTDAEKQTNREKSRERVVVEHAIGGVKVWRIVKEQIRSWCHRLRDRVLYVACGLHNFRLKCRAHPIRT
jgi:hypothetical protein